MSNSRPTKKDGMLRTKRSIKYAHGTVLTMSDPGKIKKEEFNILMKLSLGRRLRSK